MKNVVRAVNFVVAQSNKLDDWCDQSVWHLGMAVLIGIGMITIVFNVGLGIYAHAVLLK